jgi:hypothetical protein
MGRERVVSSRLDVADMAVIEAKEVLAVEPGASSG